MTNAKARTLLNIRGFIRVFPDHRNKYLLGNNGVKGKSLLAPKEFGELFIISAVMISEGNAIVRSMTLLDSEDS